MSGIPTTPANISALVAGVAFFFALPAVAAVDSNCGSGYGACPASTGASFGTTPSDGPELGSRQYVSNLVAERDDLRNRFFARLPPNLHRYIYHRSDPGSLDAFNALVVQAKDLVEAAQDSELVSELTYLLLQEPWLDDPGTMISRAELASMHARALERFCLASRRSCAILHLILHYSFGIEHAARNDLEAEMMVARRIADAYAVAMREKALIGADRTLEREKCLEWRQTALHFMPFLARPDEGSVSKCRWTWE
ncbi:MAG: hypothetical protein B0A82_23715 [Alkalinema sp. CACIAM 70d]|nr:MAG: hypothetical protein B0A82_23715 [Alkalinema sp. CACIAM 70d]